MLGLKPTRKNTATAAVKEQLLRCDFVLVSEPQGPPAPIVRQAPPLPRQVLKPRQISACNGYPPLAPRPTLQQRTRKHVSLFFLLSTLLRSGGFRHRHETTLSIYQHHPLSVALDTRVSDRTDTALPNVKECQGAIGPLSQVVGLDVHQEQALLLSPKQGLKQGQEDVEAECVEESPLLLPTLCMPAGNVNKFLRNQLAEKEGKNSTV
jgi:hypothetical protein